MAIDAYDPDTGFTRDVVLEMTDDMVLRLSSRMKWRFWRPGNDHEFRMDAWQAFIEAKPDAWLLQWQNEFGNNAGEVPCAPMLVEMADEMAYVASGTTDLKNADWARHWAAVAMDGREVVGAQGAARHCALAIGENGEDWVRGFVAGSMSKARGVLA